MTHTDGGERKIDFDIAKFRENMTIESPIKNGQIVDWDLLEKIWEYAMNRYMKVDIGLGWCEIMEIVDIA